MKNIQHLLTFSLVSLAILPVAEAKRAPVSITRDRIANINGMYAVKGTSRYCSDPLLQHPDGGSLCGDFADCDDVLFFNGQHGKQITWSWDRDARTVKPVKEVVTLDALPAATLNACAPNNIDYGMAPVDELPNSAFRYENINGASLKHSPVRMTFSGFNLITWTTMDITWEGTGNVSERLGGCESLIDLETKTCLTFRYKQRTKPQRLKGDVTGTWWSDFFIDPLCNRPWEMGCVPRDFTVPVDFAPARATWVDATITETAIEIAVEPMVRGGCACPLVEY